MFDIPLPVMLLTTVKLVSTPVVLGVMMQVREKVVPALRVVLRLRRKVKGEMGAGTVWANNCYNHSNNIILPELTFYSNSEGHRFRVVGNCPRYGLKSSTGVISSLRGVEVIEDQSAYEIDVRGWTSSRNGEVLSTANDIAPWIKPLHC